MEGRVPARRATGFDRRPHREEMVEAQGIAVGHVVKTLTLTLTPTLTRWRRKASQSATWSWRTSNRICGRLAAQYQIVYASACRRRLRPAFHTWHRRAVQLRGAAATIDRLCRYVVGWRALSRWIRGVASLQRRAVLTAIAER